MPNMSYCRFENTVSDLRDCVDAMEEGGPDGEEEIRAAKRMKDLCKRYLAAYKEQDFGSRK
jgi:hypothetical protein